MTEVSSKNKPQEKRIRKNEPSDFWADGESFCPLWQSDRMMDDVWKLKAGIKLVLCGECILLSPKNKNEQNMSGLGGNSLEEDKN